MQLGLAVVNHLVNYYWAMMDSDLEQVMFGTLFASFTKCNPTKKKLHFNRNQLLSNKFIKHHPITKLSICISWLIYTPTYFSHIWPSSGRSSKIIVEITNWFYITCIYLVHCSIVIGVEINLLLLYFMKLLQQQNAIKSSETHHHIRLFKRVNVSQTTSTSIIRVLLRLDTQAVRNM